MTNERARDIIITAKALRGAISVAVNFFILRKCNSFCLPRMREVMLMFATWEEIFLFCTLIVAIISLILSIYKKK